MRKFFLVSFVFSIIILSAVSCSETEKIRVLPAENKIVSSEELDALKLQISISRKLWNRAGKSYTESAKEELAAAGRAADAIASDPSSTPEQLEAARKTLKDATAVFKNAFSGEADLTALAEAILNAENLLSSGEPDQGTITEIDTALEKAYSVYSTDASASEVREALTVLEALRNR